MATWKAGDDLVTVPGSFISTSAAGMVPSAGNGQSELVTFTSADSTDRSTVTTNVIVNVAAAPPLVTVEWLQTEKVKAGKGKKAKNDTVLVLQFSGALAADDNANAYELAPAITVKAKGKGKHKQPATSRLGTPITPASAVYSDSNYQVTLTPRGTLNLRKPEELIVNGALVTDTLGRPIDGNDEGQPGGDYIATISGSRVTVRVTLGASDGTAGHGPSRDRRPARSRRADRVDPLAACPERGPSRGKSTDTRICK